MPIHLYFVLSVAKPNHLGMYTCIPLSHPN